MQLKAGPMDLFERINKRRAREEERMKKKCKIYEAWMCTFVHDDGITIQQMALLFVFGMQKRQNV